MTLNRKEVGGVNHWFLGVPVGGARPATLGLMSEMKEEGMGLMSVLPGDM